MNGGKQRDWTAVGLHGQILWYFTTNISIS